MADRGHVFQPGEDPLAPHPMTPEQLAAFMEQARANTTPVDIETGRRNRERWARWRADQGRP